MLIFPFKKEQQQQVFNNSQERSECFPFSYAGDHLAWVVNRLIPAYQVVTLGNVCTPPYAETAPIRPVTYRNGLQQVLP